MTITTTRRVLFTRDELSKYWQSGDVIEFRGLDYLVKRVNGIFCLCPLDRDELTLWLSRAETVRELYKVL